MDYPPQQPYWRNLNRVPLYNNFFLNRYRGDRRGGCLRGLMFLISVLFVLFILTITIPQVDILHLFHGRVTGTGESTVLAVSSHPTLVIDSEVSSSSRFENQDKAPIHIQAVATNQKLTLNAANVATDPNDGSASRVIHYSQTQGGDVTTLQVLSGYTGSINITVPMQTNLKISTLSSSVEVIGVTGQMVLLTNSGLLRIKNSTLSGASVLDSNSGSIEVEQSTLEQVVTLSNNSGPITFNGRLNARGNYHLIDNSGRIDVTLSSKDAFHLDAVVNGGTIAAEFPRLTGTNKEMHGDVGGSNRAQLSLYNNSGSIKIQQA
jgi:hypothetical protein